MATSSFDKSLYQAPMGLDDMGAAGDEAIEIEIVDPESVKIGIGGVELEIDPDAMSEEDFSANLAEEMTSSSRRGHPSHDVLFRCIWHDPSRRDNKDRDDSQWDSCHDWNEWPAAHRIPRLRTRGSTA